MATKPQRKRRTKSQRQADGRAMAGAVTTLIGVAVERERRRYRRHLAALWVAVVIVGILAVVL